MIRFLGAVLFLLAASPGIAGPLNWGNIGVPQQQAGELQTWVVPGASIDLDFANDRYFAAGVPAGARSSFFTTARASVGTNLLYTSPSGSPYITFASGKPRIVAGRGILVEGARTNYLLNSAAPATQTTGTLPNATYTLWVNGSGSATMSPGTATGCGTATATQGSPISFTTSAATGNCTITVAGSLNEFQLENGAYATSFIPTAGATVPRAADDIEVVSAVFSKINLAEGAFYVAYVSNPSATGGVISFNDGTGNNRYDIQTLSNVTQVRYVIRNTGTSFVNVSLGIGTPTNAEMVATLFWNSAGARCYTRGGLNRTAAAISMSGENKFQVGMSDGTLTAPLSQYIKRIAYSQGFIANAATMMGY